MSVESLDFKELEPVLSPFSESAIAFNATHDELLMAASAWLRLGSAGQERYCTAQAAVDSAAHSMIMYGMRDELVDPEKNRAVIAEAFRSADVERLNIYGALRAAKYEPADKRMQEWDELLAAVGTSNEAWFATRSVNLFMSHVRKDVVALSPCKASLSERIARKMAEKPSATVLAVSGAAVAGGLALAGALKFASRSK